MTMATLARARAMTVRDWRDFCECVFALGVVHVALRVRSPARVVGGPSSPGAVKPPLSDREIRRWTRLVDAASRHVMPASCLTRSIALSRVLRRRGTDAAVRIGVRTADNRVEAHAWVEIDGRPVNDEVAVTRAYAPFPQTVADRADVLARLR